MGIHPGPKKQHYLTAPTGPSPEKILTTGHDNSVELEGDVEEYYEVQQPEQANIVLPLPERNDVVRKLEYQKALEKQVLEKKLQQKHEKEVNALQDKLDDLKNANYWLHVQQAVGVKPQQSKVVFGNPNDPFYQPVEPNGAVKTIQRPQQSSFKKMPPVQNTRPLKSSKNISDL